ncbi:hypothetical protein GCM10011512_09000 [Tersicoccus solisilvae]|uniref:Uncharacterized protein n=1 Tax=Tersicoccus solisilvae TaxID=1882339 RepID=A0ABQ1NSK1_9MICC|nr:hypothetical protein [Tersicoccus solisilvae]GGC84370.1 hypothetical protein GCM10011512_09000 [Tersicoccus solisilvae]
MSRPNRWALYARDPESASPIDRRGPFGLAVLALGSAACFAVVEMAALTLLVPRRIQPLTGELILITSGGGLLFGVPMAALWVWSRRKARLRDDRQPLVGQLHRAWHARRIPDQPLPGFREEIEKSAGRGRGSIAIVVFLHVALVVWLVLRVSTTADPTLVALGWATVLVLASLLCVS